MGYVEKSVTWKLTAVGKAAVKTAWHLQLHQRVLEVTDTPNTRYELLKTLDSAGFTLRCVAKSKDISQVRQKPGYKHGDEDKVYYCISRRSQLSDLNLYYLKALCSAEALEVEIPHLASTNDYRRLLEPDFVPRARNVKRKIMVEGDDWDALRPKTKRQRHREPKKRQGRPRRQQRRAFAEPVVEAGDGDAADVDSDDEIASDDSKGDAADVDSDDVAASDDSKGSASGSGNDSSNDSPASSSASSSTSTSSSSSSSSKRSGPPAAPAEEHPPTVPDNKKAAAEHQRRPKRAMQFGQCFFTPRMKAGQLAGYQMTCTHPKHQSPKCTKELSISVAGDNDMCQRMLQAWVVYGSTLPTRDSHMKEAWKLIMQLRDDKAVPTLLQLQEEAPQDWDEVSKSKPVKSKKAPKLKGRAAAEDADDQLLGDALPEVPPEVHAEMVSLAQQGFLPITTPAQRRRNLGTA
eukprot:6487267-Amphidinium_carterae.1